MRPLGTRTGNYEAFRYANRQEVHKGSHILPPPPSHPPSPPQTLPTCLASFQAHYYNVNDEIQLCSLQLPLFPDVCFLPWSFMIRIYVVSNAIMSAIRKHNLNVMLHVAIDKSFIPFVLPSASSSTTIIISIINFVVVATVSIVITSSSYFS